MVEGMGGKDSIYYNQFRTYCCEAFNILRKSSDLILNLFTLMIDANIPHVNQAEKSVYKVQEKLKLDLTDEQASAYFQGMINESVRALAPQIAETMHRWAKYWRS
jgi:phosphatidylinositol 3-kinase